MKRLVLMMVRPRPNAVALMPMATMCIVLAMGGLDMDATAAAGENRVESLLSRMTLEDKVGQMVMAGFPGKLPEAEVRTLSERSLKNGTSEG